jgi:hypothetical protein
MIYNYRDDPVLGPALAYWARKRGPNSMPRKRDIDPVELSRKLLPNIQIIEVVDGGARFRYRLVGTASVDAFGSDYTGRYVDEMFSDNRLNFILSIYSTVRTTKIPLFSLNRYHTTKSIDLYAYRIYMPLSENGIEVDNILGILRFESGVAADAGWREGAKLDPFGQHTESIEIDRPALEPVS